MLQMDATHAGGQVRCPACARVFTLGALPPQEPAIPTATLAPQHGSPSRPSTAAVPAAIPSPQKPSAQPPATPGRPTGRAPQRPGTAQPSRVPASGHTGRSAPAPADEERKAKLTLAAIIVGAIAAVAVLVHFGLRYLSTVHGDATGVDQVLRMDAERISEREKIAIREQRASEARMEEERKTEHKKMRDALSLNVCGGDDAVAEELLTALEQVQEKTVTALNAGTVPADVPAFMEDALLKRMTESAVLRKWFGPRSPREFAHSFIAAMFGSQQAAADRGTPEQPGVIPSVLASGKYGGVGSGFYISADGWIITNQHVARSASSVDIRDASGQIHPARVVKTDQTADLALLKTSATSEAWLSLSKGEANLGTHVFTIGYPRPTLQGIEPKFTDGSISSLKGLHDDAGTYQISVPLQPGNSGGALVHLESGWVVGVVVSILTGPQAQNVNYAVKSKMVRTLLESTPEARSILNASEPVHLQDPGAIIDKVKAATVLVLVPRS